jgi:hypothetical protein
VHRPGLLAGHRGQDDPDTTAHRTRHDSDAARPHRHPLLSGCRNRWPPVIIRGMTGSDVAMLALTLLGFALIATLPYAAFRLVELAEDALDRARDRT